MGSQSETNLLTISRIFSILVIYQVRPFPTAKAVLTMRNSQKSRVLTLLHETNPEAHLIDYRIGLSQYSVDMDYYELGSPPKSKRVVLCVKKYNWLTAA